MAQNCETEASCLVRPIGALTSGIPMGRMTTPEDVGDACVFLASSLASNIAGANLLVHGGGDPIGALPARPDVLQHRAMRPWWALRDSNPGPLPCEGSALTS